MSERPYEFEVHELRKLFGDRVMEMSADEEFQKAAMVMSDRKWKRRQYLVVAPDRARLVELQKIIHESAGRRVRNERQFYIKFQSGSEVRFVSCAEQARGMEPEMVVCA